MEDPNYERETLGFGLRPGDTHYRAYVGHPEEYDMIAAMTFNLLTSVGLRQHHTLLDIGCGSLRVGRLLLPYLNTGNYVGIEPNQWLVEAGIKKEVGMDLIRIKTPKFFYTDSPKVLSDASLLFDFAVAQFIFSHCGLDLMRRWLVGISPFLSTTGALLATFFLAAEDFGGTGWIYPDCVSYTPGTLKGAASEAGLKLELLDWRHPRRQTWGLFSKPEFDTSWLEEKPLTWNAASTSQDTNFLREELCRLQQERILFQRTLGWQLLTSYWRNVESLLPTGTKRRRILDRLVHHIQS